MFAHKPRLLDVTAQLKRSAHAALGLAINCARNTICRPTAAAGLLFGRLKQLPGGNTGGGVCAALLYRPLKLSQLGKEF